jgi:NADPH:quinone reductase-like Zn-dependent oxidoreductase
VAAEAGSLAEVPATVDLAQAAGLPVAGVAALRALRAAGPLLGRRVLITGASGGVGRFAVRLASIAGGHVIAVVARPPGVRAWPRPAPTKWWLACRA